MPHGLTTESKRRDQSKCSECRQVRLKCTWKTRGSKCDYCIAHSLECSPKYKASEDPKFKRPRSSTAAAAAISEGNDARAEASSQDPEPGPPPPPPTCGIEREVQQVQTPSQPASDPGENLNVNRTLLAESNLDTLKQQASTELEKLNVLGFASIYVSRLAPVSCNSLGARGVYEATLSEILLMLKQELHALFIQIYKYAFELDLPEDHSRTLEVLLRLSWAIDRIPGLCDDAKRKALLKIIQFFQDRGCHGEAEHILSKVADLHEQSGLLLHATEPCDMLLESYTKSSEKAHQYLASLWQQKFDAVRFGLTMPPLQRAVQRSGFGVATAILQSHRNNFIPLSDMLGQHAIHIAAADGSEFHLYQIIMEIRKVGLTVDVRDLHQRTPLFLAAEKGHHKCCSSLLRSGASIRPRDAHGHSIIEVAARGGFKDIVSLLVYYNDTVNPDLGQCGSTPLQAAVESGNVDLINYLMDKGASVSDCRPRDGKTAIDLAETKGWTLLAESMRQKNATHNAAQEVLSPHGEVSNPENLYANLEYRDLSYETGLGNGLNLF